MIQSEQSLSQRYWPCLRRKDSKPHLDGRGGTGECDEGAGGLVPDGGAGGVEEVVDAADEAGALRGIGMANLQHIHTFMHTRCLESYLWKKSQKLHLIHLTFRISCGI